MFEIQPTLFILGTSLEYIIASLRVRHLHGPADVPGDCATAARQRCSRMTTASPNTDPRLAAPTCKGVAHRRGQTIFRVQSAECRVQSAECRVQSAEYRVQSAECRVQSAECRVQSTECRVQRRPPPFGLRTEAVHYSCTTRLVLVRCWSSRCRERMTTLSTRPTPIMLVSMLEPP